MPGRVHGLSLPHEQPLQHMKSATAAPRLQVSPTTSTAGPQGCFAGCPGLACTPLVQLTSSWAAPLCTEWMFSFRLCWRQREGASEVQPQTVPAGSEL